MRYHPQTKFGVPGGNCFATCLACVFDLDSPDSVPNFCYDVDQGADWMSPVSRWTEKHFGLCAINLRSPDNIPKESDLLRQVIESSGALYIAGVHTRRGHLHAVVGRGGKIIHDPFPGGSSIVGEPVDYTIFFALDPAKSSVKEQSQCVKPWWKKRWLRFPLTAAQSG